MATVPASDQILERLKQLHPKVIDLALDRVQGLLDALGAPHTALPPVVHVAGTNGKGSTVATLRAITEAAGRTAHVYISPHLVRFSERITVASREITDADLAELLAECEARNQGRPITFFEITTAAAFLAFARTPADLCLLETGLGGRYDATNVVPKPALTAITSISMDHQAFLGDSLTAIAGEKAGIIKAGVPCLTVRQAPEVLAVLRAQADALGAPLLVEGRDWEVSQAAGGLRFAMGEQRLDLPLPALIGRHQIQNAGLAVAAALSLPGPFAIAEGLRRARWPARLQRLTKGPLVDLLPMGWEVWLDGGHNPGAGQVLAAHVAAEWRDRPLDLLVGMLNSKDSQGFVDPLVPYVRQLATLAIPGEANSLSAEAMAAAARAAGFTAAAASDGLDDAVRRLVTQPGPARLLICGSLYLAGRVLAENG